MTLEAEMEGVTPSKERGATRSWMRREGPSLSALGGSAALPTSCLAFWPPELGKNNVLSVKPPVCGALSQQPQHTAAGTPPSLRARSKSSVPRALGKHCHTGLRGDELRLGQTGGHWDLSQPLVPHL